MAPIVVDPEVLAGAGTSIASVGKELSAALNALTSALGGGMPTGVDAAGFAFGNAYQKSAQALLGAGVAAVDAGHGMGFGVQMSATNYSRADAASTIGGGESPLIPPVPPAEFHAAGCPSPTAGGVPPPFLWSMIQAFIPDVWPDGNPGVLKVSAGAWDAFASTVDGISGGLFGPSGIISGQQIPEGGAMLSAISEVSQALSQIASESKNIATQIREFAGDVEATQNAIRDLVDRLSPSGFMATLESIFGGDAYEELKEVAEAVRTILGEFGRQTEARAQLLRQLIEWMDNSVVSLQRWARKEFTHYLGEDVGGLAANAFEWQTNVGEGFVKAGLETVQGIQALDPTRFAYDSEGAKATWGALAETAMYANPTYALMNPQGTFEHGKEMLEGIVHAEDWRADRPGLGVGAVGFEVVSSVTGVGAAKSATKGVTHAAAEAADGAPVRQMAGIAGEVSTIGENAGKIADNLDDLADRFPSGALPDSKGPAVPPSLASPEVAVAQTVPETLPHRVPESLEAARVAEPTPPSPGAAGPQDSPPVDAPPTNRNSPAWAPNGQLSEAPSRTESDIPSGDGAGHAPAGARDHQDPPINDGVASDGRIKFSGHGSYDAADGVFVVPDGLSVTVYGEHGSTITDALGNLIETGGDTTSVFSRTFGTGESMPNYTLHPPDGLKVQGAPLTVEEATRFVDLLREKIGDVDFAACVYDPSSPSGLVYDIDGIYDETTGTFTHIYEKPGDKGWFDDEDLDIVVSSDSADKMTIYEIDQHDLSSHDWDYTDIDFDEF
ncbi:MAG: putative adhesin [Aeromicrobium sp.]